MRFLPAVTKLTTRLSSPPASLPMTTNSLPVAAVTLTAFIMAIPASAYSTSFTNSPHHITKRQLLYEESENATTTEDLQTDHRDNFELFATIVGVVGGATLITGFGAFCWSLYQKQKERISKAREQEVNRRIEEGKLLQNLFRHRPTFHTDTLGSMATVIPVQQPDPQETATAEQTDQSFNNAVQAVISENTTSLGQILTDNPDVIHQADSHGDTLLHYAHEVEITRLLLRRGANPNYTNNAGLTAVHIAAAANNQPVLTLLLDWMETISFRDLSALFHIAASSEDAALLRYFVTRGLHERLRFERQQLASIRADQQAIQTSSGSTLLHEAVTANNLDAVIYILKTGLVDVNATDDHGNTPLHFAALSLGTNAACEQGQAEAGSPNIINTLLNNGANINAQNDEEHTPLHRAVLRNNRATVQMLLSRRPDLGIRANGYTPVELACLKNYGTIVSLLAPESRVRNRRHRARLLRQIVSLNLIETLTSLPPQSTANLFDVNALDADGNTALHLACVEGRVEIVKALLRLGARRDNVNRQGKTPRDLANTRKPHIAGAIIAELDTPPEANPEDGKVLEMEPLVGFGQ